MIFVDGGVSYFFAYGVELPQYGQTFIFIKKGNESIEIDDHHTSGILHYLKNLGMTDLLAHQNCLIFYVDSSESGPTRDQGRGIGEHQHGVVPRVAVADVCEFGVKLRSTDFDFVGVVGLLLHLIIVWVGKLYEYKRILDYQF